MYKYWLVYYKITTEESLPEGKALVRTGIEFISLQEIKECLADEASVSFENVIIISLHQTSKEDYDKYPEDDTDTTAEEDSNKKRHLKLV